MTVAVSFQVVLVVGRSKVIAPINAAGALNYNCPACTTTAIADQIVVTLTALPSQQLLKRLEAALRELNALPALGPGGTPTAVASQVAAVQHQIETTLAGSGLLANPPSSSTTTTTPASGGQSTSTGGSTSSGTGSSSSAPAGSSSTSSGTTTPSAAPQTTTSTTTTTTTAPSTQSTGSGSSSSPTTTSTTGSTG
jgi:putative peptide zinc metalloprotease protein